MNVTCNMGENKLINFSKCRIFSDFAESNNDYIIRATYKDSYWNHSKLKQFYQFTTAFLFVLHISIFIFFLICIMVAFVNFFLINER